MQNYLMIQENVVTNIVVWDGNIETWQPPQNATMLVQYVTLAKVWVYSDTNKDYVLETLMGSGNIGFTWDGTILTTNEQKPQLPQG